MCLLASCCHLVCLVLIFGVVCCLLFRLDVVCLLLLTKVCWCFCRFVFDFSCFVVVAGNYLVLGGLVCVLLGWTTMVFSIEILR